MQDSRIWLVGGALIALVILALGWFVLIAPERSSAADRRTQTANIEQQNALLQARTQSLREKSKNLPTYTASLRAALAALPYDGALPSFTRELNAHAKANRVFLSSVTVGGVTPVVAAAPTAGATSPTPTPSGELLQLQVTLQSEGALSDQLAFLAAVRTDGPRRVLVTSTQLSPTTGTSKTASVNQSSTMTTQLTAFSAPKSSAEVAKLEKLLRGDLTP